MSALGRRQEAARDPSRRERLATIVRVLGDSEAGADFGLLRLAGLADFRESVPLMDRASHSERVTTRLGFGDAELSPEQLCAAEVERPALLAAWRQRLGGGRPTRVALLQAPADDPLIDGMRGDDLDALATGPAELLRLRALDRDPERLITALHDFHPDALVVPSLATCAWLEGALRAPLERRFSSLRWIFAEHDLDERVRSRLPVINAGWIHAAGRIGLPARRSPWHGFTLATRSTLLELLPHGDPEIDPRQRAAEATVLPEQAVVGERYELVLSSPLGFLRLRSGEHLRVVGFAPPSATGEGRDSLPRPRVVRVPPPPPDVALEGVTLAGARLTASVRQAFMPEDPALVSAEIAADPDALDAEVRASRTGLDPFRDTELGASRAGARRKGPKPRGLVVRVEVQGQADPQFPLRMSARIDADLRRRSAAYEWLRTRNDLWEPRVVVARPGTSRRNRERRLRALWGPVERPVVRVAGQV